VARTDPPSDVRLLVIQRGRRLRPQRLRGHSRTDTHRTLPRTRCPRMSRTRRTADRIRTAHPHTPRHSSTGLRCSRPDPPPPHNILGKVGNIPLRSTRRLPDSTRTRRYLSPRPARSKSWAPRNKRPNLAHRNRCRDPCSRRHRSIRPAGRHPHSNTYSRPLDALSSKQVSSVTLEAKRGLEGESGPLAGGDTRATWGKKREASGFEKSRGGN